MADETKNQRQGGQTNYGSQQGGQQGQPGQQQQGGQSGQEKNADLNKKNPSTGTTGGQNVEDEDENQNRDRQRRAS